MVPKGIEARVDVQPDEIGSAAGNGLIQRIESRLMIGKSRLQQRQANG
jgi:hypothetical protein